MYLSIVLTTLIAGCIAAPKFDLLSAADAQDFAERYAAGNLSASKFNSTIQLCYNVIN